MIESKIQNKLAIIAITTGTYVALLALFYSAPEGSDIIKIISLLVLVAGFIPVGFFWLYLLFLPLRYKSSNKNIFWIESENYKVDTKKIDRLFDIGAGWLIPTFVGGFCYFLVYKILSLLLGTTNTLVGLGLPIFGYYLSHIFIRYIVGAKKIDKGYRFGSGFLWLLKLVVHKVKVKMGLTF